MFLSTIQKYLTCHLITGIYKNIEIREAEILVYKEYITALLL